MSLPKNSKILFLKSNLLYNKLDFSIQAFNLEEILKNFFQKKKENVKIQKEKLTEQKKSGAVFEIKIPKIILRNLSFKVIFQNLNK